LPRTKRDVEPLETIWEVPDPLWERIEPILLEDAPPPPKRHGGRPRIDWRQAINGVIFRLRSGCTAGFSGGAATVSLGGSGPPWSRSATILGRSSGSGRRPTGCWAKPGSGGKKTGKNPTDRGKKGTKKSLLVERDGGPLGMVVAGANVPDFQLLDETIEAVVVERPDPEELEQHLCLDAGYDNAPTREVVESHGYVGHIRPAREGPRPKRRPGRRKARRWVVERTLAWLSKCRALLVRYDKHDENFLGLIQLACGLLWYRRLYRLNAA
jgi:putative transposase